MTNLPPPRPGPEQPLGVPDPAAEGWYGVPDVPASYVSRTRLFEVLDRSETLPLVLVSAPAGAGKTSMVADWVASRDSTSTQWVTFEAGEENFWPGLVGGLARLGVQVPPGSDPEGAVPVGRRELTALAAAVAGHPRRMTLVLDGYELVSSAIARDLDFLMRHAGRRLGLVMVTRVDPVLPLYRYRLEESLAEVRMADLAFSDDEAASLTRAAGVELSAASVHTLNQRTEGWVAGLRFAAVFLAAQSDPDDAVSEVAGDTGNIASFLMGEVLAAQGPETRALLLRTSVPDVLQPGLAETLAGRSATRTLASLSRRNAFVEPVPEHPDFYRYHPFFRDLLRAELAYEAPDEMQFLHRLAAEWLAEDGQLAAAVSHFVGIGAWDEAAEQVVDDLAVAELLVGGPDAPLARELRSMPARVRGDAASIVRATLALADHDTDRCSEELAGVSEAAVEPKDDHARAVSVAVAVLKAVRARTASDTLVATELADEAREAVGGQEDPRVALHPELAALVHVSQGMASLRRGRLGEAEAYFESGADSLARTRALEALRAECLGYLALIAVLRDRLKRARSLAARTIEVADQAGLTPAERPPGAQIALALADIEQSQLLDAHEHVRLAAVSEYAFGEPVTSALLALARARLDASTGNAARGLVTAEEAAADLVDPRGWLAVILRIEAGRLRLATNDPVGGLAAVEGLDERQPGAVAIVVAQAHLAKRDTASAQAALAPALDPSSPVRDQVTGWLLESACRLRRGQRGPAGVALDRALRLAAKEHVRRPFREAPAGVAALLSEAPEADVSWLHLPAHRARPAVPLPRDPLPRSSPESESAPLVVEHLTAKELQVLALLAELLSTEEIADALFVSVNTIRTHVRSILRKLGVSRRNAAVRRARELELLPR